MATTDAKENTGAAAAAAAAPKLTTEQRGDLWGFLQTQQQNVAQSKGTGKGKDKDADGGPMPALAAAGEECFVLFVGDKGSGKTTLRQHFLNPAKELEVRPKPTVGLEYQYGRRMNASSNAKDVAHVWEMAGAARRARDLMGVALTPARLERRAVVVVMVDLSRPGDLVPAARYWLQTAGALAAAGGGGGGGASRDTPKLPKTARVVLVGTKLDALASEDGAKRKMLLSALRFAAHSVGASLVTTSSASDAVGKDSLKAFRMLLTSAVFGAASRKARSVDSEGRGRAVVVTAGADDEADIGIPSGTTPAEYAALPWAAKMELWERTLAGFFEPSADAESYRGASGGGGGMGGGEEGKSSELEVDGSGAAADAAQFAERAVDEARAARDAALQRYRREAEKRAKVAAMDGADGGGGGGGTVRRSRSRAAGGGARSKSKGGSSSSSSSRSKRSSGSSRGATEAKGEL